MSISLLSEKYIPVLIAAAATSICLLLQTEIVCLFRNYDLSMRGLYSAVFGWSAVQTGFLFGVFGFVAGSQDSFISEVRDTIPVRRFVVYTRNATLIGFILTFASMPMMVINLDRPSENLCAYVLTALWFGLFVWAFLAFARVAYLFGLLMQPKAKPFIPA